MNDAHVVLAFDGVESRVDIASHGFGNRHRERITSGSKFALFRRIEGWSNTGVAMAGSVGSPRRCMKSGRRKPR